MPLTTSKKVLFLQEYISEWAEKMMEIHYENITGIRIDKKCVSGIEKTRYAIIFQVKSKIDKTKLKKSQIIPDYFDILFPDGITRRLKTDIHKTGAFRSQSYVGSTVECNQYSKGFGSLGLFVKEDDGDTIFAITNYHVLARKLLKQNKFEYTSTKGSLANVTLRKGNSQIMGLFHCGEMNVMVDVAFVIVEKKPELQTILPNGEKANTYWTRDGFSHL